MDKASKVCDTVLKQIKNISSVDAKKDYFTLQISNIWHECTIDPVNAKNITSQDRNRDTYELEARRVSIFQTECINEKVRC